jgi:hypothetical protein
MYWLLTDFCINFSNFLGITYTEFNFLLFCVVVPFITLVLLFINIYRYLLKPVIARMKK